MKPNLLSSVRIQSDTELCTGKQKPKKFQNWTVQLTLESKVGF